MGDSTCLMQQQPFSYVAGLPNSSNEGNPIHALGQSVSFGRFMTESLAWEKWSSFSHNRYVEEAERYSRPGSVAQKKAFFEAHYKNLAARKAAALLEQANAAAAAEAAAATENNVPETETEPQQDSEVQNSVIEDSENVIDNSGLELEKPEAGFGADENRENLDVNLEKSESKDQEEVVVILTGNQAVVEEFVKVESVSQDTAAGDYEEVKETELSGSKLMEKPLLKDFMARREDSAPVSKKKSAVSSSKSLSSLRASNFLCSPTRPGALHRSRKENNITPISKRPAVDSIERKKPTPKSNHKSMNFTPVREINRLTSSIIRKIDNSRVGSNSKASKEYCSTPIKTPTTGSVLRGSKHPLATPQSESRRAKTPLHSSASASKTARSKWNFLPTECSKFISSCRKKPQSPSPSTPFSLRTEERAVRRKERLEEKFNANQVDKVQLQATLKEKAETEIKKLRQTLCFKARPLPSFYKERVTQKNHIEKVPLTQAESPDLRRTPNHSMAQNSPQLTRKPSIKNSNSKQISGKKNDNPRSLASRLREIAHENTSPNIWNETVA